MSQYLVLECRLQFFACSVKEFKLMLGERIEVITVATHEMREYRARNDCVLVLQSAYHLVDVLLWVESQAMHTGIEFDMNGIIGYCFILGSLDEGVHNTETINLRFEVVVEHRLEGSHLGVHNHDIARDTVLAQSDALVSHCHCQIIHTMVL